MEVVIKLKDEAPPKVRTRGMFLGDKKITIKPARVVFKSKDEAETFLKTVQFQTYMEEVKVKKDERDSFELAETIADQFKKKDLQG